MSIQTEMILALAGTGKLISSYDGCWNYPSQTPGFWAVCGESVTYYHPALRKFVKSAHIYREEVEEWIDTGEWVPNTWRPQ